MNRTGQGRPSSSPSSTSAAPSAPQLLEQVVLEALAQYVSPERIAAVLQETSRRRRRKRRVRRLPPAAVIWLVIAIGLWSDVDVPSLWRQVVGTLASLWRAATDATSGGVKPPCKSALSQARTRLGARPLRLLFKSTAAKAAKLRATPPTRGAMYKTIPLKAMDGDDFTLADTPANVKAFGKPTTARDGKRISAGHPHAHVTRLIEVGTRMTLDALIKPQHAVDRPSAPYLLRNCSRGDLVLWDCGFYSYKLIRQALDQGTFALGPVASPIVLECVRRLSDGSFLAKVYPDSKRRERDKHGTIVRVIEYTFDDPARPGHRERHRLVTTLLDAEAYPAAELIVLYHQRWEIEIANDEITTHLLAGRTATTELRSKMPAGVVQEIYGVLLAHNAVRALMVEAAATIDVDPRTLSFIHAVRVIRETIPLMRSARTEQLPALYAAMLRHIAAGVLPPRDNRINPRVVKVKMSNFKKKRPEHYNWPQPAKPFAESIVMLN
jgi:hypothetical protein